MYLYNNYKKILKLNVPRWAACSVTTHYTYIIIIGCTVIGDSTGTPDRLNYCKSVDIVSRNRVHVVRPSKIFVLLIVISRHVCVS